MVATLAMDPRTLTFESGSMKLVPAFARDNVALLINPDFNIVRET